MTQGLQIIIAWALASVLTQDANVKTHDTAAAFTQKVAGTALSIEMLPVPGEGTRVWMSETEIPWELYDAFVYRLDEPSAEGTEGAPAKKSKPVDDTGKGGAADALARPSKPYILMDRGFGHAGYPVISVSAKGAAAFCAWLSAKSGKKYRLPSEAEWERACAAPAPENLDEYAWYLENAERKTHPVKTKKPNAAGFYDLAGNASEWCTDKDGKPMARGGSYRTLGAGVGCAMRLAPSASWNASDPQIPKSTWWLADGGFVGFRIVCEP